MSHCTLRRQESRSMTVNARTPVRTAVRTAVRNFESVARNPVLCSPDVDPATEGSISNGDILQWDITKGPINSGAFTNVTPQSANVILSNNAKEFLISSGGNDNAGGGDSSSALLTFQRALYLAGKSDAYESVTFYVTGDVAWNPASNTPGYRDQTRLREGSFGGNLSQGIVIRGLKDVLPTERTPSDPPRSISSQLVPQAPQPSLAFTADATYSEGTAVAYDLNIAATAIVPFYRGDSDSFYPVAFDTTAHTTPKRRVYLSTSGAQPDVSAPNKLKPYKFAGKVTMNNGGTTANPGFAMTGNVQFVEVHFELQDGVKTPYHVNGEFVILYSKFSKTSGGLGATLELSVSGAGTDHLPTLRVDPTSANSLEGGPIIQVYKSIFENLTVKFSSATQIHDSVFIGCVIENPDKCEFKGCTFFNCGIGTTPALNFGDDTKSDSLKSSAKFTTCQFQYSVPATSLISLSDNSTIELNEVIIRATDNLNAAQNKPLIDCSEGSAVSLDNVKINGKLNNEATELASIIDAKNSSLGIKDVNIAGGSGELSFFHTNNSTVKLYDVDDACTNTGPLLTTYDSDVQITAFDVATANYTVTAAGIFNFYNSSVKINSIFSIIIDGGVTTTDTIFQLKNSTLKNFPGTIATRGKFNIQNNLAKHSIKANGSDINIDTIANAPHSQDIHGAIDLENSNAVITCDTAATVTLNYQGTNGAHTINCVASNLYMKNISIDGTGAGASTALNVIDGSKIFLKTGSINNVGFTGKSTIHVNNSELTIDDGNITAAAANNKSLIDITNGSKFTYLKGGGAGSTITSNGNSSTEALRISNNSSVLLDKIGITSDVSGASAIVVTNHSSLTGIGTNGSPENYTATAGAGGDNVISVNNSSSLSLVDINLETASTPAVGVHVHNLSNFYGKTLTGTTLEGNGAFVADFNSKVHLEALSNSGADFSGTGYTTGGTSTQAWSTIVSSPFIYPIQGGLATTWNAVKGCVVTYKS